MSATNIDVYEIVESRDMGFDGEKLTVEFLGVAVANAPSTGELISYKDKLWEVQYVVHITGSRDVEAHVTPAIVTFARKDKV